MSKVDFVVYGLLPLNAHFTCILGVCPISYHFNLVFKFIWGKSVSDRSKLGNVYNKCSYILLPLPLTIAYTVDFDVSTAFFLSEQVLLYKCR